MGSEEIFEKVKKVIMEQLGVSDSAITLEEEFDIEIPDSDAEKVATVGDVVDYIKEHVA